MGDKGVDEIINDSRKLIGNEVTDFLASIEVAYIDNMYDVSISLGDTNPLYTDPGYASTTRYGALVGHPAFLIAVRTPVSRGTFADKDYGLADFITGIEFECFDVIRLRDKLTTAMKLFNVSETSGIFFVTKKRGAVLASEASYWNQHGELVGKARGEVTMIPIERGKEMLIDRDIYKYSDAEIKQIIDGLEGMAPPRGSELRYWEEVDVGEKLPPLVKGPLSIKDCFSWLMWTGQIAEESLGNLTYRYLKEKPGLVHVNPETNWPFWDADQEYECFWTCKLKGMPGPTYRGNGLAAVSETIVTNWMGDDGFLRKLSVEKMKPFIYGDVMWLTGEVVDKYKEQIRGERYRAVEVQITGTNQLNDVIVSGLATVYLPDPGHEVALPIPH